MSPHFLYVHVPFCARRCSYCDFAVEASPRPPTAAWVEAIGAEMQLLARERRWTEPLELQTIYIGGGTPSLLDPGAMKALQRRLSPAARWAPDSVEWTCEANPESFTRGLAEDWRGAGVNRISLGVQTFHEPSLRWMGRLHGAGGPARAVGAAREVGFQNVSVDLIFGLPADLGRTWADDLARAVELEPDHISLYGLTAESATPLGRWVREGRAVLADENRYADEYLLAHERLVAAGFEHYEVSNFTRPGRASKHNAAYWRGMSYAALGPGAHSYFPPARRWNLRGWGAYRDAVSAGRLPIDDQEEVGEGERALEQLWLGLRTRDGVPLAAASSAQILLAEAWSAAGWAEIRDDWVVLTPRGWLLLDRLALEFADAVPASSP